MNSRTVHPRRQHRIRTVLVASAAACAAAIGSAGAATAAPAAGHVPWNHLSHGWTMATWTAKGRSGATVYLIGPRGGTYPMTTVSRSAYPLASSPDGKTVLLTGRHGVLRLDLRSRHRSTFNLPDGQILGFTRNGHSLIASIDRTRHGQFLLPRLERFGLDGHHEVDFPVRVSGSGRLDTFRMLALPKGRLAVGARHGAVVLRRDGSVASRIAKSLRRCSVVSGWGKGKALAECGNGVLWAVPLGGGHATRLTDGASKENPFGYSLAWRYGKGRLGLAENGCGPASLVRFNRNGHGNRIAVPSPTRQLGTPSYVGHHGNVVDMLFNPVGGLPGTTRPGVCVQRGEEHQPDTARWTGERWPCDRRDRVGRLSADQSRRVVAVRGVDQLSSVAVLTAFAARRSTTQAVTDSRRGRSSGRCPRDVPGSTRRPDARRR